MKAQNDKSSVNGGEKVAEGKVKKVRSKKGPNSLRTKMSRQEESTEESEESPEVMQYLHKLQEMVPQMPKDKRLSNLDVINHAINYIRDLQDTLGLPLCDNETYLSDEDEDSLLTFDETDHISCSSEIQSSLQPSSSATEISPVFINNNKGNYINTFSLSVSTSSPSSPSNEENDVQQQNLHHNLINSVNSRRPFFAISNLNSGASPTDSNPSTVPMQESLPLKQISCLL